MAKATVPTTKSTGEVLRTEQAAHLLSEIADQASSADRSIYWGPQPHEADAEQMWLHVNKLRAVICRIGWMPADHATDGQGQAWQRGDGESERDFLDRACSGVDASLRGCARVLLVGAA